MAGTLRATIFTAVKGDAAEKLAKQLDTVSGKMTSFGNIASKAVKGIASLGAALVSSKFIGDSVEQAKNLERSILALDSVFGATAPRMVEFSKNAVSMGLSQSEAAKASTFLGSVLQQYGFSSADAAVETEKLTKLSADLAATYGYDVQEALLAVTALFRGEYDPIEKFGVAMKQNEINAIRNARGLGDLTGAAEMQADAQIRLELLMQRSTAAQGAMERGAGTLYVETEKLRATFENLQANLGQQLIPVFAELFEKLRPIIEDAAPAMVEIFKFVGEVIQELAQIFLDLFDPTTQIGESVLSLGNAFEGLFETIFGRDFNIAAVFDGVRWAIDLVIRAMNDLVLIIQNVIFFGQAVAQVFQALFSGDWDSPALQKGIMGITEELINQRDAALLAANALQTWRYQAEKAAQLETDARLRQGADYLSFLSKRAAEAGGEAGDIFAKQFNESAGAATKDAVAEFWAGLTEEVEKQAARMRLEAMGASEGLIGAILGASGDWQKVFDSIVSGGIAAVTRAQEIFNKTAAGIKEIEEAAKKAKEQLDKLRDAEVQRSRQMASSRPEAAEYWNTYANMIEAGYEKEQAIQVAREEYAMALDARIQQQIATQRQLAATFTETADAIFNSFRSAGVVEELGIYQTAVRDLRTELVALIEDTREGDARSLFGGQTRDELITSIGQVTDTMEVVSRARDQLVKDIEATSADLETRVGQRKSLLETITNAIMGGVSITEVGRSATTIIKSLTRTLQQTKAFGEQITQLRNLGLAGSAIDQIINAGAVQGGATAKALIAGGKDSIAQINSLYSQIEGAATSIGLEAADTMYGSGIKMTEGLLDGLLSQQSELERVAEQLGTAFQQAFDRAASGGMITFESPGYDAILQAISASSTITGNIAGAGPIRGGGGSGVFNITVNAGMGTNGQSVGQMIVDEIKRFERQSGRVFISA